MLLPSRIESIPVVFSDSVQLGTPLIATPVGDLPRLHDKFRFGVLASATTASAYAEAIRLALNQSAISFSSSIDEAREGFNLQAITQRFVDQIGLDSA